MKVPARGFTHGGKFHADDVFATALLRILRPDFKVQRGFEVPDDFDGIVYDIGGGMFDHHDASRAERPNGVPYAAFGLLWKVFGPQLVGEHQARLLDENFVQPLDLNDNTGEDCLLADAIGGFNPLWDSKDDPDACFAKAVDFAQVILQNNIDGANAVNRADALVKKALDQDHFGLEKVKERILEFVAVKQLAPQLKGQVLCLVGPPGVGKTSIAMSMARAMNRKLARISLGGVSDEAEIRGHRKTYVGAMPGRIISAINQAGSCNPLILLDEIDKLGHDHRGDPASALLEVLDGEQNSTFRDNFLEIPFDLSEVMFITTANTTETIPRPLLDRMEVIELSSYTDEEKLQIAKKHLLPKELKRHGLSRQQLKVSDGAIREIIASYTRESGVRVLERNLAALCRKSAMKIVANSVKSIHITGKQLQEFLGAPRYYPERQVLEERVGVVNGLAWTSVGGELLEVEVNVVPGSGKVELTGNLGDVMKESAHAALSYIRSQSDRLGISVDFYKEKDIHVHFPEGAVPKDGPSAGIAITTAMVSALTGTPVRRGIAMTGEVTLRGRVLPIGGLKEKTMAAFRNGIKTVIIPADNGKDLEEIDQTVRKALQFVLVERADQVLSQALLQPLPVVGQGEPSQQKTGEEPVIPELVAPNNTRPAARLRQ